MNHSRLLLDENPLVVLPELATKIGLNEAIVLQQVHFWTHKDGIGKDHEGQRWVRNTYQQWQENFPFWSLSTVRRVIENLEGAGLLLSADLNHHKYDQTKWYAVDYDKLNDVTEATTQNEQDHLLKMSSPSTQNEQMEMPKMSKPIPETTTETTTENVDDVPSSSADAPDDPEQAIIEAEEAATPDAEKEINCNDVVSAYQQELGYDVPSWGREAKAAKWMLEHGYNLNEILLCYRDMKRDPWWRDKPLHLQSVKNRIGEWRATHAVDSGDVIEMPRGLAVIEQEAGVL